MTREGAPTGDAAPDRGASHVHRPSKPGDSAISQVGHKTPEPSKTGSEWCLSPASHPLFVSWPSGAQSACANLDKLGQPALAKDGTRMTRIARMELGFVAKETEKPVFIRVHPCPRIGGGHDSFTTYCGVPPDSKLDARSKSKYHIAD